MSATNYKRGTFRDSGIYDFKNGAYFAWRDRNRFAFTIGDDGVYFDREGIYQFCELAGYRVVDVRGGPRIEEWPAPAVEILGERRYITGPVTTGHWVGPDNWRFGNGSRVEWRGGDKFGLSFKGAGVVIRRHHLRAAAQLCGFAVTDDHGEVPVELWKDERVPWESSGRSR